MDPIHYPLNDGSTLMLATAEFNGQPGYRVLLRGNPARSPTGIPKMQELARYPSAGPEAYAHARKLLEEAAHSYEKEFGKVFVQNDPSTFHKPRRMSRGR